VLNKNTGSIEFWVSPKYDTYNDPNIRFYFDATAASDDEVISLTTTVVKINGMANRILSVRLLTDTSNTGDNYFSDGSLENDKLTIMLKNPLPHPQVPVKV